MKQTEVIMGMPISIEIIEPPRKSLEAIETAARKAFEYFKHIDEKFSTYKTTSEITAINEGKLGEEDWSDEMRLIFALSEETKKQTNGYFNIKTPNGNLDPSGIVKGWSIWQAAKLLEKEGFNDFYVDAGGDIQPSGKNSEGKAWAVGIKNPWNEAENIKVAYIYNEGIATSGIYIRGLHIYNPQKDNVPIDEIVSLTVIGPNIYEADRFATAAFAMGWAGIEFIEKLDGFEGYVVDKNKVATMTSGFEKYTDPNRQNNR